MLQRPDRRYERVKYATQDCLNLRAVTFNDMFEYRCCENKEGDRVDDPPVYFREVVGMRIRIEPPDEEDGSVHLDVVFYTLEVRGLGFHKSKEDNRVGHMDKENGPEVCRRVKMPEIYH